MLSGRYNVWEFLVPSAHAFYAAKPVVHASTDALVNRKFVLSGIMFTEKEYIGIVHGYHLSDSFAFWVCFVVWEPTYVPAHYPEIVRVVERTFVAKDCPL